MTRPADDTTKPSRLNRRRKKRWKISDLIESGLTDCGRVAMLFTAGTSSTGSRNPAVLAKSPQPIAAFLCLSFSAALCRLHSVMAGCFGQRSALAGFQYPVFDPITARRPIASKLSAAVYSSVLEQPL